jgi:hypothetical protein
MEAMQQAGEIRQGTDAIALFEDNAFEVPHVVLQPLLWHATRSATDAASSGSTSLVQRLVHGATAVNIEIEDDIHEGCSRLRHGSHTSRSCP